MICLVVGCAATGGDADDLQHRREFNGDVENLAATDVSTNQLADDERARCDV